MWKCSLDRSVHYYGVIVRAMASNHQPHDCLLNRLFRHISKKTSTLLVTGLYEENSPVTDEFPAQRASNAENVFNWWRHHDMTTILRIANLTNTAQIQYISYNMYSFAVFCFVFYILWTLRWRMWFFHPCFAGLLHWRWGNRILLQFHWNNQEPHCKKQRLIITRWCVTNLTLVLITLQNKHAWC